MNTQLNKAWQIFLDSVRTQLPSSSDYLNWFEPIRPISWENNRLTIRVPNQDFFEMMENKYIDVLRTNLRAAFGDDVHLKYQVLDNYVRPVVTDPNQVEVRIGATTQVTHHERIEAPAPSTAIPSAPVSTPAFNSHLDARMRMDNFYQSLCNRLACNAAANVVEQPGHNPFNPLFIHGASGVGKTHIIHAIGNEILRRDSTRRIIYVPASTFKQQYVHATMVAKKPEQFFLFYQNIDVLLIDDIQELTDAVSTQNAFFQIFNNLKLLGKQIIITSDRAPVNLKGLEDRLYTRMKWGLTVEIDRPDVQLRRKILESKLKREGVTIPDDVFHFIIKHCKDNVRDIEGSLTTILAHALYKSVPVNLELATHVMAQTVGIEERKVTIDDIAQLVCKYYDIAVEDIMGKKRARKVTQARQLTMYLAKEHTALSLSRIGKEIGGRDHSSVIYATRNIQNLIESDMELKADYQQILELLNN